MAFGGSIQDALFQLETLGFFDFVLPFLLIFAVIFGILSYTKVFKDQKAVNIIVAIILGLLSIRLEFFSIFLTEISPRMGVGLTIILSMVILLGMFLPDQYRDIMNWIMLAIGAVVFVVILLQSADVLNYFGYGPGFFSGEVIGWIIMIGVLVAIIVVVSIGNSGSKTIRYGNMGPGSFWGPPTVMVDQDGKPIAPPKGSS